MFSQPVTQAYDMTDATWEIIIMLLIAFLLGWFFRWLWDRSEDGLEVPQQAPRPERYMRFTEDNLQIVEGIGPKIEELLKTNGVMNWSELAAASIDTLKGILGKGGERFQMHDPSSWADQAALAVEGKWEELQEYQTLLPGGRIR
jgi:hypothetical protein